MVDLKSAPFGEAFESATKRIRLLPPANPSDNLGVPPQDKGVRLAHTGAGTRYCAFHRSISPTPPCCTEFDATLLKRKTPHFPHTAEIFFDPRR
jgi:hypothetical protein